MKYMEQGEFPVSRYLTAKAARQKIPISGTFELTSRCNFNCKMCYIHGMEDMDSLRKGELSVKEWLSIAEEAKKEGLLFLLLTGGEAMIRDDFMELYEALAQMGFRLVINTNGSLVTDEILDLFRRYPPGRVNVSMYGASEETYSRLCGVRRRDRVAKAIQDLKALGISVRMIMTITPYNCEDMQAVYGFSRREGTLLEMTSYMFPPVRRDEGMQGENAARFSAAEAGRYMVEKECIALTPEQRHERAVKVTEHVKRMEEILSDPQREKPERGEGICCQAGRSSFWITWDGRMKICGLTPEPEADVRELGFAAAWEATHRAASQIRLPVECSSCARAELCRACAAMCQTETGYYDHRPQYICDMSASMLEVYRREAERGSEV